MRSSATPPMQLLLLLLALLLNHLESSVVMKEGYDTVGHIGHEQSIRLRHPTPIPQKSTLHLPISIVPPLYTISGSGPPKVTSVSSSTGNSSPSFGVGEEVSIHVKFTSPVVVEGDVGVLVSTGCGGRDSCRVKEVQQFTCLADEGKVSLLPMLLIESLRWLIHPSSPPCCETTATLPLLPFLRFHEANLTPLFCLSSSSADITLTPKTDCRTGPPYLVCSPLSTQQLCC